HDDRRRRHRGAEEHHRRPRPPPPQVGQRSSSHEARRRHTGCHAVARRARDVGGDGGHRGDRPPRGRGGAARLPPPHVQRARRAAGCGGRADDAIRALRASLSELEPEYRGEHYAYDGLVVDPNAVQPRVPIWIGGRTARSLRRAIELADGWAPFGLSRADLAGMIARARDTEAWPARAQAADAPPFELVLQNEHPFDPEAEPDRVRESAGRL